MRTRHNWLAIAAALWLLAGGSLAERATAHTRGQQGEPLAPDAHAALHARMVAELEGANPSLAGGTAVRIADSVQRCSLDQGLPPDLVLAVMLVESDARVSVRSPKGAIGLMQVMPHMFAELSLPGNVAHLEANVEAGCLLLADNIRRLGEDDGVSAYYWGSSIRDDAYLRRVKRVRRGLALRLEPVPSRGRG